MGWAYQYAANLKLSSKAILLFQELRGADDRVVSSALSRALDQSHFLSGFDQTGLHRVVFNVCNAPLHFILCARICVVPIDMKAVKMTIII